MMRLVLKNKQGDALTFEHGGPFTIVEVDGLNPPQATINTSKMALFDGEKFNSSKVNMRQMNVAFAIEKDAAASRIEVYKVLKSKQYVKVEYYGDYRKVYIEGYIESINIDYFAMKQVVTASILCPAPYFKEAQTIINGVDSIINMFHFPFAITVDEPIPFGEFESLTNAIITNEGDIPCGMTIEIYARGTVKNPKVFNYITAEYIGINFTMETGDTVTIDTTQGNKTITLLRDGQYTNIFNTLQKGSKWLQLETGENSFVYEADEGAANMAITFGHNNLYEGV